MRILCSVPHDAMTASGNAQYSDLCAFWLHQKVCNIQTTLQKAI